MNTDMLPSQPRRPWQPAIATAAAAAMLATVAGCAAGPSRQANDAIPSAVPSPVAAASTAPSPSRTKTSASPSSAPTSQRPSGAPSQAQTADPCALPRRYRWNSTGPLATPKSGWVSLKDFTTVPYKGKHLVYATTHDTATACGR